jgi:membrane protein DedA with SNARE-associated domain
MVQPLDDLVDRGLRLLADLDVGTLAALMVLFTALEATALVGLLVPGDAMVLLAGSTIDGPDRFGLLLSSTTAGTLAGAWIGYAIGRAIGPRLRTTWLGRRLGEQRWTRVESYLADAGAAMLVPLRFVSFVHVIGPLVAGTVRMPWRRFAIWSGLASLAWATTYTTAGAVAGTAYRHYGHLGLYTSVAVTSVVLTVVLVRVRRRRAVRG